MIMEILLSLNLFFMLATLYAAFSPKYRPISWGSFWLNIAGAVVNAIALGIGLYRIFQ